MVKMGCIFELIPLAAVLLRTVAVVLSQECQLDALCAEISSTTPALRKC